MERGSYITVHLIEPVERLWGRLQHLDTAGLIMRGFDVHDVETFKYQLRSEEKSVFPQTFFFPMRRILKIDLDEPVGNVPSVVEAIAQVQECPFEEIIALE